VRLGITAPDGLPVYREELFAQIAEENARASQAGDLDALETSISNDSKPRASDS